MNITEEFINNELRDASDYQKFLVTWIIDLGARNQESFNYNNINDIAIGIYLLCKDLGLDPINENNKFIEYFNKQYGYGSLIQKLLTDFVEAKSDYYDILTKISDIHYCNQFMAYDDLSKHIETLYNNENLSEEENKETLIFGDNILNNDMTIRELSDAIRMMTIDYVSEYVADMNLGEISFTISDSSIMYLKDTAGIGLAVVHARNSTPKHVIRYTNENGSALFLLFEPVLIKTETIYGLSLDSAIDEERGLLILEKEKDGSVYRLLYGKGDF